MKNTWHKQTFAIGYKSRFYSGKYPISKYHEQPGKPENAICLDMILFSFNFLYSGFQCWQICRTKPCRNNEDINFLHEIIYNGANGNPIPAGFAHLSFSVFVISTHHRRHSRVVSCAGAHWSELFLPFMPCVRRLKIPPEVWPLYLLYA